MKILEKEFGLEHLLFKERTCKVCGQTKDLIDEFYKITGVPVIINTSMNVMGEPIVNTPEQAHAMILKTDMDYLVMGDFILSK